MSNTKGFKKEGQVWTVKDNRVAGSESELFDLLMKDRGVKRGDRQAFLNPDFERDLADPCLFKDMKEAVERVGKALRHKERILVYGDYDVDGITSLAIMVTVLKELGLNPTPYLPDRMGDGYGLNIKVLKEISGQFDLLVTVDCGVNNGDEIEYLKSLGKEAIITDHHELAQGAPEAEAVLHPRHPGGDYPFPWLSGAGVAWAFARALLKNYKSKNVDNCLVETLVLACLGTVADSVPLLGENRTIVYYGLKALRHSSKPGVRMLCDYAEREGGVLNEDDLAFRVIPLLNASGRIEHAQPSLDLLIAQRSEEAEEALLKLKACNEKRRQWSKQVMSEAEIQIKNTDAPVVFASNPSWPAGIVGLVANRLSERFCRPAVIVGGCGENAVGSGRAPAGMSVLDIIARGKDCLLKFGGHECAVGFSLSHDKVELLRDRLLSKSLGGFGGEASVYILRADLIITSELIDWRTIGILEKMAPYGEGNNKPVFISKRMTLIDWRVVGKTGEHVKFLFQRDNDMVGGIGFGMAEVCNLNMFKAGEKVDVAYGLEVNDYQGRQSLQLNVKGVAKTGSVRITNSDRVSKVKGR